MREPKDLFDLADDTKHVSKLYVKYKLDYYKLHLAEKVTNLATFLIGGFLLVTLLTLFLLFISLAFAMYLGEVLQSPTYGYLIVGVIYLAGIVLLGIFRGKLIQRPILRVVIREFFPEPKTRKKNDR
ncbi:hypothetical protein BH09BAC1_BH09BAC1_06890 [soil metagenome]